MLLAMGDRSHKPSAPLVCEPGSRCAGIHKPIAMGRRCMTHLCRCLGCMVKRARSSTAGTTYPCRPRFHAVGAKLVKIVFRLLRAAHRTPISSFINEMSPLHPHELVRPLLCMRVTILRTCKQRKWVDRDALPCRALPAWHATQVGSAFYPGGPQPLSSTPALRLAKSRLGQLGCLLIQ